MKIFALGMVAQAALMWWIHPLLLVGQVLVLVWFVTIPRPQ